MDKFEKAKKVVLKSPIVQIIVPIARRLGSAMLPGVPQEKLDEVLPEIIAVGIEPLCKVVEERFTDETLDRMLRISTLDDMTDYNRTIGKFVDVAFDDLHGAIQKFQNLDKVLEERFGHLRSPIKAS